MEMQGEQYNFTQLLAGVGGSAGQPAHLSHLFSGVHRSPLVVSNEYGTTADQMVEMYSTGQLGADIHHLAQLGGGASCFRRMDQSSPAGFEMENSALWDVGNGRWPRQETLTLLEMRSRLDSKFKEANQKGPLWDEVARLMTSEHGYQRTGKKCREKFENLYKYYRKTKEGKAGRQDGKHYRFFRQLDALCGEKSSRGVEANTWNIPTKPYLDHVSNSASTQAMNNHEPLKNSKVLWEGLNFSDSSCFEYTSSEDGETVMENDHSSMGKKEGSKRFKSGRKSWKTKLKEFIELQTRKFMEMQEAWLEKMLKTLEDREQERLKREEQWRKLELERQDREHRHRTRERAWIEARDAALMEALQKISYQRNQLNNLADSHDGGATMDPFHDHIDNYHENGNDPSPDCTMKAEKWNESELSCLIKLKANSELRYEEDGGCSDQSELWEVISAKMNCLGYERSWMSCREKWEENSNQDCNKKRKENSKTSCISSSDHNYLESLNELRVSSAHFTRSENEQLFNNNIGHKIMINTRSGPSSSAYNSVRKVMTQDESTMAAFLAMGGSSESSLWDSYATFKLSAYKTRDDESED